jgi:hypothetical protein
MKPIGEAVIWIEDSALEYMLTAKEKVPCNANIFKVDPTLTSYPCYKPRKLRVVIYEA